MCEVVAATAMLLGHVFMGRCSGMFRIACVQHKFTYLSHTYSDEARIQIKHTDRDTRRTKDMQALQVESTCGSLVTVASWFMEIKLLSYSHSKRVE